MRRAYVLVLLAACKYAALPPLSGGDGGHDGSNGGDGPLPPGSPMIAAISPAIATVGTTLVLDGTFSDPMTVNFPGGVSATATVFGTHRARVDVPAGATSGPLTASTGSVTTNAVFFRTPSFAPGLANFRVQFEQTDAARMPATLAAARSGAGTAVVGQHLYVIGGKNASTYLTTIEHALINADGTLNAFSLVTGTTLVTGRANATTVVLGGYVYVIGGSNASGPLASVERAQIQSDGTLGAFATVSGVALATARGDAASAIVGDSLYIIGGTGSGKLGSIESAVIDPDGTLEAFTTSTQALAMPRAGAAAFVAGGHLYVLGGELASGFTASIEDSALGADGTLGTFATSAATLLAPRGYFSVAMIGTNVYACGGTSTSGELVASELAAVQADGTIGNFSSFTGGTLMTGRYRAAMAIARDHVFMIGGTSASNDLNSVEHSGIATHGMIGAYAALSGDPLAGNRAEASAVMIGDHMYYVGGVNLATLSARTDVDSATVNPDGSLGPFGIVNGVTLTTTRQGSALMVIGNYLYVIGGVASGTKLGLTSIERAPINFDGTLGTFAAYSSATLSTGRSFMSAIITNTHLYVMGGTASGMDGVASVDEAQVDAQGSLSFFFNSGSTSLYAAAGGYMPAVLGNKVWVFGGGGSSGNSMKAYQFATIQSDGTLGTFAYPTSAGNQLLMSTERELAAVNVIGDDLYLVAGATNIGSPPDPGVFNVDHATIASDGSLGGFATVGGLTLSEGDFYIAGANAGNFVYFMGGGSHTNANAGAEVKSATLP